MKEDNPIHHKCLEAYKELERSTLNGMLSRRDCLWFVPKIPLIGMRFEGEKFGERDPYISEEKLFPLFEGEEIHWMDQAEDDAIRKGEYRHLGYVPWIYGGYGVDNYITNSYGEEPIFLGVVNLLERLGDHFKSLEAVSKMMRTGEISIPTHFSAIPAGKIECPDYCLTTERDHNLITKPGCSYSIILLRELR
ncbi:MAG: hypothetical protein V2A62_01620 [Candidatus Woesearchaeota archaeon]